MKLFVYFWVLPSVTRYFTLKFAFIFSEETKAEALEKMLYLRLRLGQPIGSKIKRDEMINTYGENNVQPDYWFVLTQSRAEFVHDFFNGKEDPFRVYGVLDVMAIERAGLELVREGRSAIEAEPGRTATRATVAKLDKSHLSFASVDFSVIAPMVGESELMSKEERIYLAKVMPQKLEMHHWILSFSTSEQGFSLQNMMRKLSGKGGALLLLVSDVKNHVFGAFLSGVPAISEHFDGKCSCLFTFVSKSQLFIYIQYLLSAFSIHSFPTVSCLFTFF